MINLLPHNKVAYENVMAHFKTSRRAAVIQPTGTGKAYIGGAVASHFKKVYVVAPNEYVLAQAKLTAPDAYPLTYSWLSRNDSLPTDADLIWFDEIHRMGAETWQDGAQRFIDANPDAKILGTTATPIRHLEQRDMADEFFRGDVASTMSIADAWVRHILRVPRYIIGVISMDDTLSDYETRINKTKRVSQQQKNEAVAKLNNIIRDWSLSHGVPSILKKHLDDGVERMIVFAQTISKVEEVKNILPTWFNKADIKLANIYTAYSTQDDAAEQLKAFSNDTTDGVKVLISVDMLNEGIHVKDVDAVMLLRSTISKNLYLQQIGRCFAVGQRHQPIVFDLADNLSSAFGYDGIFEAQERYIREAGAYASIYEGDEFDVFDTLKDTRDLLAQLGGEYYLHYDYDIRLRDLVSFCEKHDALPSCYHKPATEEKKEERSLFLFMHYNLSRPEIKALYDKYKDFAHLSEAEKKVAIKQFCIKNERLPHQFRGKMQGVSRERRFESALAMYIYRNKNDEFIKDIVDRYREFKDYSFDEKYDLVLQFINQNGRHPRSVSNKSMAECTKEEWYEVQLANFLIKNKDDERVIALREEQDDYRVLSAETIRERIKAWCEAHGTYPIGVRDDKEQKRMAGYIKLHSDDEALLAIIRPYGYVSFAEQKAMKMDALRAFIETSRRLPSSKSKDAEEVSLYNVYHGLIKKRDPEAMEWRKKYTKFIKFDYDVEEAVAKVTEFIQTYHRLPRIENGENELASMHNRVCKDKRVLECKRKYLSNARMAGDVNYHTLRKQQLIEFVGKNGYLPAHGSKDRVEKVVANYWSRFRSTDEDVMRIYAETPSKAQYLAMKNRERLVEYLKTNGQPKTCNRDLRDLFYKYKNDADIQEIIKSWG